MIEYMLITVIGVLLYFSFDEQRWTEFKAPMYGLADTQIGSDGFVFVWILQGPSSPSLFTRSNSMDCRSDSAWAYSVRGCGWCVASAPENAVSVEANARCALYRN